jgi:hypothetical protein
MAYRILISAEAIVAAIAMSFAVPTSAVAADFEFDDYEIAQAPPTAFPAPIQAGGDRQMPFPPRLAPRNTCKEGVARHIGQRAYQKVVLELKPSQMTLWAAFENAADDVDAKEMARCSALPLELKESPTLVQRMAFDEDMMKERLASIQALNAPLFALYDALTPEQKTVLDLPLGIPGRGRPPGPPPLPR